MFKGENVKKFGAFLYALRLKNGYTLRAICKKVDYDPSNWSKIERGKISPPSDEKILRNWAKALGIKTSDRRFKDFVYRANVAQGIIPFEIMAEKDLVAELPAFFRTLNNKKPNKKEIDKIISFIKNA